MINHMTGLDEGFHDHLILSSYSEDTIKTYLRWLHRYDAEVGVTCTDRAAVRHWLANRTWSPGTRKGARTAIRSWYRWACSEGLMDYDPTAHLPKIKVPKTLPRPAPEDVWLQAWQGCRCWRERVIVLLACHSGLRRSEIAAFHRDWIEGDVLRVRGKGGKTRLVPASPALARELAVWPFKDEGWLLPGRWGGHVEPSYVGKRLSRLLGPGWSGHTLRHRAATCAYEVSGDLAAVQDMLGHASPETTRVYTLVSGKHVRAAVLAGAELSPAPALHPVAPAA